MAIDVVTYQLPCFWVTPLMYGDYDGLDESEEKGIEGFRQDHPDLWLASVEDDHHFANYHDATCYNVLPTEVCTFTFYSMA